MILKDYLNSKPLYYDEIDYTRMPRVYEKIKSSLPLKNIIHIIGTNGKGTTGRFLANALHAMGHSVGHYTSPHILEFNERVWANGSNATDAELESAHRELQKLLPKSDADTLSYFEYTTLLSAIIFKRCDYVVMEAGLGGEFDATAVFSKRLTLVTPIAYDHEAFLGLEIESIASTKLNAIQNSAILSSQSYNKVYQVVDRLKSEKSLNIKRADEILDEKDKELIGDISKNLSLAPYLTHNLSLSIAALKFLNLEYKIEHFSAAPLFGRITKISDDIIIDVGHNALAAQSVADALRGEKYIIIYNSYKDKNYQEILRILRPIALHVEIITIGDKRAEKIENIETVLDSLGIKYSIFNKIKPKQKYLVFGSFSVVERFLRECHE
ncbi:bifunctional folylpolyglutamate synthase/dihydrofolate synthase [Sulfurimonas sp.]|uniref:bifunctional folylpolyglutamate synthase/dihydrofolate synthase n=1 Tax=Sulfurimonas sp. TaxID=2022749 RepID=UPI0025D5408B|nr:bifunctional folylpolyglutamate synthase/dihydrofolate synthase [Sulfurimonas sp.]